METFVVDIIMAISRGRRGRDGVVQLPVQSVIINTNVVSSNPTNGKMYSMPHYVIKFVSDLRQVCGFLPVLLLNIVENGIKHHDPKLHFNSLDINFLWLSVVNSYNRSIYYPLNSITIPRIHFHLFHINFRSGKFLPLVNN